MGSVLVVVPAPIPWLFPSICKAHEPVRVRAFRSELAVERLDEPLVRGFLGPRKVKGDLVSIGSEIEVAVGELGIGRPAEPGMGIHDGQETQLLGQGELVVHEVHRIDIVRPNGLLAVIPKLGLHPPLRMLVPELQAQLIVYPADPLHVDHSCCRPLTARSDCRNSIRQASRKLAAPQKHLLGRIDNRFPLGWACRGNSSFLVTQFDISMLVR